MCLRSMGKFAKDELRKGKGGKMRSTVSEDRTVAQGDMDSKWRPDSGTGRDGQ